MTRSIRSILSVAALLALPGLATAQLKTPTDWRWVTDAPATLVTEQAVADSAWRFVAMPPGWHVTTGPGVLLYHPDVMAQGRFTVTSEVFLFPGQSLEEYGVFVGGADLEGPNRGYIAFVARRDGAAAVFRQQGAERTPLVAWAVNPGVLTQSGNAVVKNVFKVAADSAGVAFSVNDSLVARVPMEGMGLGGRVGFRVGSGVNLHLSTLDVTRHLAPPRPPQNP